ncbi:MAG: phosphotransferase [Actinomycetota bacterium]
MQESGAAHDLGAAVSSDAGLAATLPPVHPNIGAALGALLGHTPGVTAQTSGAVAGRVVDTFSVLPSTRDPRLLVPSSRPAAAGALRQHTNATTRSLWLKTEAMAMAMRLGAGRKIARGRLTVVADDSFAGDLPLKELLAGVFGPGPLELAVRLGPLRPNRKPVIQVLRPGGKVLGYAKVSRTDLTARLVANEGRMLSQIAEAGPRSFQVPPVLHAGEWAGQQVLVVGLLPRRRVALGGADARMPVKVARELAELLGTSREPLAACGHWRSTLARIAAVEGPAADALAEVAAELDRRHGSRELAVGLWHGDWTPSNMAGSGKIISVWDLERSGPGMPIGMDAGHFGFHIARKVKKLAPEHAAAATLKWLPETLEGMGVEGRHAELMLALALLEMAVRFQEARAEGVEVTDPAYLGALQDLLTTR